MSRALSVCLAVAFTACVDPSPEWYAKNVEGYAETAAGLPPDTVFGWGFSFEGGVARWRECLAVDTCSDIERRRPARDVLAVERVGQVEAADGGGVDVVKLSLTPRPKYVVPITRARSR